MKKGGHHPEETKRKIGESGKGKKHNFTVETKNKLKESKLGEKISRL